MTTSAHPSDLGRPLGAPGLTTRSVTTRATADELLTSALSTIAHLERALGSSREIGASIGILMERHGLTYEDAWHLLRGSSQDRNVPVRDLASELVLTGVLDTAPGAGNSFGALPAAG